LRVADVRQRAGDDHAVEARECAPDLASVALATAGVSLREAVPLGNSIVTGPGKPAAGRPTPHPDPREPEAGRNPGSDSPPERDPTRRRHTGRCRPRDGNHAA